MKRPLLFQWYCPILYWIALTVHSVVLIRYTRGQDEIGNIALDLSYSLSELFQNSTRHLDLQQIYADTASEATVVDGSEIVDTIADASLVHFRSIQETLQDIASQIEDLYASFNNTGCCSVECDRSLDSFSRQECDNTCHYVNVSDSFMAMRHMSDLSSFSSIFIPLNIYENDTSVLCFAQWSKNVTDVFEGASEELSQHYVPFIFFGDKSGVIKSLPAYNWGKDSYSCVSCPYDCVNTYDPRTRPWYVDSASGAKHVVILIDHSGSMTGSSFTESTLSSSTLISNLNENDYFIVYCVGNRMTTVVSPCGTDEGGLLRASPENKLAVSKLISELPVPVGKADFEEALNKAHGLLTSASTQACHKLIFLFSDGNAVIPVDTFTSLNSGKISVFTFLVDIFGKEDELKDLACRNKGQFTLLRDFNSIGLSIRVLTVDLNQRSPNHTNAAISQFTAAVINSLVITMSIPLKPYINGRTEFIGVVGLDISEDLFEQIILEAKIGPLGSSMLVTNNGGLYRHPLMDSSVFEYFDGLRVFDFSQYEFLPDQAVAQELRKAIVNANNNSGAITTESYLSVEHKKRYLLREFTYYYRPLRTDLRLVVKLPSSGIHRLNYTVPLNLTLLAEIKEKLETGQYYQNHVFVIVGFKPRCFSQIWDNLNYPSNATSFIAMAIKEALTDNESSGASNCSSTIYEPILRDLANVYQIVSEVSQIHGVESTFYQFTSGLLYCIQPDRGTSFQCKDIVNSFTNFIALADDSPHKLFIHRGTDGSVLFETVQLLQAISVHNVSMGVAGVVIKSSYFDKLLYSQVLNSSYSSADTSLYLADNGGYTIGTSCSNTTSSSSNSSFLGSRELFLFDALVNDSVFIKQNVTGYHKRVCKPPADNQQNCSSTSGPTDLNTSTACDNELMRDVLDLCVSNIIFYTLNQSYSSGKSTDLLTENGSPYFKALNVPNTTSVLVLYESGCDLINSTTMPCPLVGEYETRNYHEYFDRKASDETCPTTDDYMEKCN